MRAAAGVRDLLRAIEAGVLPARFSPAIAFDPADDQGRHWVLEYDGPPEQAIAPAPLRQPSSGRALPWWSA